MSGKFKVSHWNCASGNHVIKIFSHLSDTVKEMKNKCPFTQKVVEIMSTENYKNIIIVYF